MGTLTFVDKELFEENLEGKGVIVVDINTQGSWDTGIHRVMKQVFPEVYKYYHDLCRLRVLFPGLVLLVEESGYEFALLVTKESRNTDPEIVHSNFEQCLLELKRLIPSDIFIYSPILGRKDKLFIHFGQSILRILGPEKRNWFVYRRKK